MQVELRGKPIELSDKQTGVIERLGRDGLETATLGELTEQIFPIFAKYPHLVDPGKSWIYKLGKKTDELIRFFEKENRKK